MRAVVEATTFGSSIAGALNADHTVEFALRDLAARRKFDEPQLILMAAELQMLLNTVGRAI